MAKFVDAKEREWELRITRGDLRRVRESAGIELGKLLADKDQLADVLFGDAENIWKVLVILLADQLKAQGLTELELEDGFDGPTALRATDALVAAIANFSQPRIAEELTATIRGAVSRAETVMKAEAAEVLTRTEAAMDEKLAELMTSRNSAASSPASPDSVTTG